MITLMLVLSFVLAVMLSSVIECSRKKISTETCKPLVEKYSAEYNVPEYIIFAVIDVESDFDPMATSSANACGLMQMTPKTFAWLTSSEHLGENLTSLDLYDPEINIRYGTYYLRYLFTRFHNWDTALAAYNAGHGRVSQWLKDERYSKDGATLYNIPIEETNNYVNKVMSVCDIYNEIYNDGEDQ
jgi:soluble lytic murein transglycosylase